MSEMKSDNKELLLLVESIASKINGAPALNGGFDRMLVMVEHIKEKQEDTSAKVDKIHDGLYEPNDGLYARVKMVENTTAAFAKRQATHLSLDEKNMESINASLKRLDAKDEEISKKAEITDRLKKITGEELEKLASVIQVKSAWGDNATKILWFVVGGLLVEIGKTIWTAIHH